MLLHLEDPWPEELGSCISPGEINELNGPVMDCGNPNCFKCNVLAWVMWSPTFPPFESGLTGRKIHGTESSIARKTLALKG